MEHVDNSVAELIARHRNACAPLARIEGELRAGTCTATSSGDLAASCTVLLEIYRARANHLARFTAHHAVALRTAVLQFCVALETHRDSRARTWSFLCADGATLLLFEEEQKHVLLGAMESYDRRKVSEERWREIWGADAPPEVES